MNVSYRPEGMMPEYTGYTVRDIEHAMYTGQILQARATMCDSDHNLTVELGCMRGFIAREDAAIGIKDGTVKDIAILSRVNKYVCFKIVRTARDENGVYAVLNRARAQEEALEHMITSFSLGDVTDAKITHIEPFGVFADIGCGNVGLISIENISVSRIAHPKERFSVGQEIKTVIRNIDYEQRRFTLSHKELLGTWEENASRFAVGQTVCGKVRSVEEYGIFIELTPNLAGLAEYRPDVTSGQSATVYIKSIIPEKMKVKLSIINCFDEKSTADNFDYRITAGHIDRFKYSPDICPKTVETDFSY